MQVLIIPANRDLRGLCSRAGVAICKACDKVMCSYCVEHNWDHDTCQLKKGARLPDEHKRRRLAEEVEDTKPLA